MAVQAPTNGLCLRFMHGNKDLFHIFIHAKPLNDAQRQIAGWLCSTTANPELKQAEEALRQAHDHLEQRVQQRTADLAAAYGELRNAIEARKRLEHELLDITERERRRIAVELHDDLGQRLTDIDLMVKSLELNL